MFNGLLFFLLLGIESSATGSLLSYSIKNNSTITLAGSSNVNRFECSIANNQANGYLTVDSDLANGQVKFQNAFLRINVGSFDCKNQLMSKDLQKTLRVDKFPHIEAELINARPIGDNSKGNPKKGKLKTSVAITISGQCRIVDVIVDWQKENATEYRFIGSKQLLMSDFEIDPPVAAFGLIKVNNDIIINFDFTIKTAPTGSINPSISELLDQ